MTYTVQLFIEDQAYGGAEEGGWYFTCGKPITSNDLARRINKRFKNLEKAQGYWKKAQALLDREINKFRPSQYSVLSRGEYKVYVCSSKPQPYPKTRPYYC